MACTSLSSVRSVNQTFKGSLVSVEMLDNGKISFCSRVAAYSKSGCLLSHFAAEYSNFGLRDPSQMLFVSFWLAVEVTLEDYCQWKDHTSSKRLWNLVQLSVCTKFIQAKVGNLNFHG